MGQKIALILFFMIFSSLINAASLVGDTVTIRHAYPSLAQTWDAPETFTVQAGTADRILFGNGHYYVNIEADRILIDFISQSAGWSPSEWNGLVVTGIDFSVTSVTTTSNWAGWSNSRVSFGADYVYFNWQGMSSVSGTYIYADVQQQIPEPASYILISMLLCGIFSIKKYKSCLF